MNRRWRLEVNALGPWAVHDGDHAATVLLYLPRHHKNAVVRFDKAGTSFPFKPIKVTVSDVGFQNLMASLHSHPIALRLTQEVLGSKCIVCDSLLCRSNWHPQRRLTEVRDEVRRGLELKLRYADRLLVWMLSERLRQLPKEVFRVVEAFL